MANSNVETLLELIPTNVYLGKLKCSVEKVSIVHGSNVNNSGHRLFIFGLKYGVLSPIFVQIPLTQVKGVALWLDRDQVHLYFELSDNGKERILDLIQYGPVRQSFDTNYVAIILNNFGNKYQAIDALIDRLEIERITVANSSWPAGGAGQSVTPPPQSIPVVDLTTAAATTPAPTVTIIAAPSVVATPRPTSTKTTFDRNRLMKARYLFRRLTPEKVTFGRVQRKRGAVIIFEAETFTITLEFKLKDMVARIPYKEIIGMAVWRENQHVFLLVQLTSEGKGQFLEQMTQFNERQFDTDHFLFTFQTGLDTLDNLKEAVQLMKIKTIKRSIMPAAAPVAPPPVLSFQAREVISGQLKFSSGKIEFGHKLTIHDIDRDPWSLTTWTLKGVAIDRSNGTLTFAIFVTCLNSSWLYKHFSGHQFDNKNIIIRFEDTDGIFDNLKQVIEYKNIRMLGKSAIPIRYRQLPPLSATTAPSFESSVTIDRLIFNGAKLEFNDNLMIRGLKSPNADSTSTLSLVYTSINGIVFNRSDGFIHIRVSLHEVNRFRIRLQLSDDCVYRRFEIDHIAVRLIDRDDTFDNLKLAVASKNLCIGDPGVYSPDATDALVASGSAVNGPAVNGSEESGVDGEIVPPDRIVTNHDTSINREEVEADPLEVVIDNSTFIDLFDAAVKYGSEVLEKKVLKYAATLPRDKLWSDLLQDRLHEYMRIKLMKRKRNTDDSE